MTVRILPLICMAGGALAQPPLPQFQKVCGACHDVEQATSQRHSLAGWQAVIDDMVTKGATARDDDFDAIAAYLTEHFGPLNVNKATGKELVDFLGVSAEQGDAIVRYRAKVGRFWDLEELKKVPGLDARVVEKKKDGIAF
jgi:competence protein ComEA